MTESLSFYTSSSPRNSLSTSTGVLNKEQPQTKQRAKERKDKLSERETLGVTW